MGSKFMILVFLMLTDGSSIHCKLSVRFAYFSFKQPKWHFFMIATMSDMITPLLPIVKDQLIDGLEVYYRKKRLKKKRYINFSNFI